MLHQVTLSCFCLLMFAGAFFDVIKLRIPNWLNIAIALLFMPAAYFGGMPPGVFGCHFAVGAIMLVIGIAMFAAGAFGGGDAKMLAAASLWLGCSGLMPFLLWTSLWGFALALWMGVRDWASGTRGRALFGKSIPYGVALAGGAIMALPSSWWMLEAVHKGTSYPGEHEAIISGELWNGVRDILKENAQDRRSKNRKRSSALLRGLIYTATGAAMTSTYTRKGDRLYQYYVSMDLLRNREVPDDSGPARLPGSMVEGAFIAEMRRLITTTEIAGPTHRCCAANLIQARSLH